MLTALGAYRWFRFALGALAGVILIRDGNPLHHRHIMARSLKPTGDCPSVSMARRSR